jgi:HEAT repeat protein
MNSMEPEVLQALIHAVNQDSNVNVRLAAIDALTKASGNPQVRQSMVQSLGQQESPMVQAALIEYLVDARDRGAMGTLRQLTGRPDLNPVVRQRADKALQQLTEYK